LLVLTQGDIAKLVTMDDLIGVMEGAFRELAEGYVEMPLRLGVRSHDPPGVMHVMPALMRKSMGLGLKVVASYPANPSRLKIPAINAIVLHVDYRSGQVGAVMNGTYLTALRTAAVSGLATDQLARRNCRNVGLIGSGVEAETHLEAMHAVRPIASAKVYSPTPSHRASFARKMSKKFGIDVKSVESGRQAVLDVDIVVTATPAREPVLKGEWLSEGVHINAIGSGTPELRELDEVVLKRSKIVADDVDAALSETGDFIVPMKEGKFSRRDVYAGLGDIVTGRKKGRFNDAEITLFKSVGLAIEDVSAAKFIYERAKRRKVGTNLPL